MRRASGANVDPLEGFPCSDLAEIWWSDVFWSEVEAGRRFESLVVLLVAAAYETFDEVVEDAVLGCGAWLGSFEVKTTSLPPSPPSLLWVRDW